MPLSKILWPLWEQVAQVAQLPIAGQTRRAKTPTTSENAMNTQRRGWTEIYPSAEPGKWELYDWSEHGDSGYLVGLYDSREDAIRQGQITAAENGRKMMQSVK